MIFTGRIFSIRQWTWSKLHNRNLKLTTDTNKNYNKMLVIIYISKTKIPNFEYH